MLHQPVDKKASRGSDVLADQGHWDSVWAAARASLEEEPARPGALARLAGPLRDSVQDYTEHALWDILYPRYVAQMAGGKVVEIGSAPGSFLVKFGRRFGLEPYGIEYTASGAELNREVFARAGVAADHVIEGDFFADEVIEKYAGSFDVVVSRGFIEHFTDVPAVVRRHVTLLRPGGRLIVAIPRFRGIYRAWMSAFDAEDLARHNLDIMERENFERAFEGQGLTPLYCGYYGAISFRRFVPNGDTRLRRMYRTLFTRLTMPANALFRAVLRGPGLENRWLSPYLIYIGERSE